MERRVTSHTEEEEMNQRRHLLALARKGDQKAVSKLMELYQVKVYSGNSLKSLKIRKLPEPPPSSRHKESLSSPKKAEAKGKPGTGQTRQLGVSKEATKGQKPTPTQKVETQKSKAKVQGGLKKATKKKVQKAKPQPKPKVKPKSKPKPPKKVKAKPKTKSKAKTPPKPQPKSKPKSKPQAKAQSKTAPPSRGKAKVKSKSTKTRR